MGSMARKAGFEFSIRLGMLPPLKITFGTFREADDPCEMFSVPVGRGEDARVDNVSYGTLSKAGSVHEGVSPNLDYCSGANFAANTNAAVMENRGKERERRSLFDEGIENIMSYQTGVTRPDTAREDEA